MKTLTVAECAELIGKSQQSIRIGLQRGFFKFGTATRPRGSWDYHIPKAAVEHYLRYGNVPVVIKEDQ